MPRNTFIQAALTGLTIIFGLSTREFGVFYPRLIATYGGDTLYALMVYFLAGLFFKTRSVLFCALTALLFCCGIEISQLYQSPWIDAVRANRLGGIVLGFGFLWSDCVCYIVGVGTGVGMELLLRQLKRPQFHVR